MLYILDTYLTNDAGFPPQIWAEFLSSTMGTTNNYESFHKKLSSNYFFNSSYPNIFNYIDILKNIQSDIYMIGIEKIREQKSKKLQKKKHLCMT